MGDSIWCNKEETPRDSIHETGLDLNLIEDPNEDWGETIPEERDSQKKSRPWTYRDELDWESWDD
jgi:hypothetical protein